MRRVQFECKLFIVTSAASSECSCEVQSFGSLMLLRTLFTFSLLASISACAFQSKPGFILFYLFFHKTVKAFKKNSVDSFLFFGFFLNMPYLSDWTIMQILWTFENM